MLDRFISLGLVAAVVGGSVGRRVATPTTAVICAGSVDDTARVIAAVFDTLAQSHRYFHTVFLSTGSDTAYAPSILVGTPLRRALSRHNISFWDGPRVRGADTVVVTIQGLEAQGRKSWLVAIHESYCYGSEKNLYSVGNSETYRVTIGRRRSVAQQIGPTVHGDGAC